jgi:Cu2+-exporting ATPase
MLQADQSCYHCGLPLPDAVDAAERFCVEIDGQPRVMCCAGCQAVAEAIVGNGLAGYYRHRDALPESPREALPRALADFKLFDHPDVQKDFVRRAAGAAGEHEQEAALILEGITCAACVWLNESHVRRQPGVTAIDINYTTRRARVRWDERVTRLSAILEAIAAIGYRAHPYDVRRAEQLAQAERKAALWRLFVAGFGMMQVMMYAVPVYLAKVGTGGDMTPDIAQLMRWASLILTSPVIVYSAAPFFSGAWRDLKQRRVGMDVPVALGVGAAFGASVWATLAAAGEVYFDSVTMFVFFLLAGRYLEMMARQKAARSVETLARAIPAFATRLEAWPGAGADPAGRRVAVATLCAGDAVRIEPGETVPADGLVLAGESAADESPLTGESAPVAKLAGDTLIGGSLNTASPLVMRVERVGEATRIAAIQRLMERAAAERPRLVELADRVAGRFVLALLVLATAAGLAWWWIEPSRALWIFVAVLVVSCPCALSLATPAAMTVATGALAARGVLVTRGHVIETLARANHFVFDKTGTLTTGSMALAEVLPVRSDAASALALAAALERGSEHPIARALTKASGDVGVEVTGSRSATGAGVEGVIQGRVWRLGRPDFAGALHGEAPPCGVQTTLTDGDTVIALSTAEGWQAFFRLSDRLRPEAAAMASRLSAAGTKLSIFSGDAPGAARRVGLALGIADVRGGLSPEDKHAALKVLQEQGATVAMVGDGVNDAPVLAQAQVSIAMGGGTDLARANSDVVLLGNNLRALPEALSLARRALRIVKQNLAWAFAYNLLAIPLAMAGWVTPWMAGAGMSASSLLVVLNALRLQHR